MKKTVLLLLSLACCFSLGACGKKASPIVLPDPEKILSIDVTAGETGFRREDPQWVRQVIEGIKAAEPTRKQSVSDAPKQKEYVKLDLHQQNGASVLFAYADQGKFYVEQPYQGIYEIDRQLYQTIQEGPDTPEKGG